MNKPDLKMKPDPQREEALFEAAAQLAGAERAAFLNGACLGDAALRQRLEALLAADDAKDSFLEPEERDTTGQPVKTMKLELADTPDEAVGTTIGRYKLMERLGEGGCGVVYVAEQSQPVRRRVALKVIKLGMDTKMVVARFEAERQALAMMDHPNIAKVLDAGTTETGRPFFVMELVRGIRITDYCDQNNLTTNERLDLFIKVCQAIQHAHQKGIIHRDIKPSNILVTLHDGVPVPKVIDFGIAKATEGRLTDNTVYTQLHKFIGTPAYMSPEQAEMSGLDIDTRSDIYSLGVLLYELLAGSTPFAGKELRASALDAMRKTTREKEPVRPSTRFATLEGEELTTTAKRRSADKAKLIHQLKGDLDWIVMKCLEKDRTRRYETANGLAFDLKRHLNNEPVLARPPSVGYKFQKAFRRNKLVFGAAAAVAVALLVGLGIAAIGWRQTRVERDKALGGRAAALASEQKAITAEAGQTRLREQAEAQALTARRTAYNSDMNLVQQALAANNLARAQGLLNRQRPQPGQLDLRGWEWRYLWSQARADDHEVFFAGTNRSFRPLSFSADGRLLAWGQRQDDETVVTDLISHRTVLQRTNAWHPVFAPHGTRLAFVDSQRFTNHDSIALLDLATHEETWLETAWRYTHWLGFTPDDRQILTVSDRAKAGDGTTDGLPWNLTAWEVNTGRQLWQRGIIGRQSIEHFGRPFAISPDGSAFAAASYNGRVQVFDTKDGSERFTIKTTEDFLVLAVAFSPDSSTLLPSAGFTDSTIRLWDAHSGKAGGSLEGHRSYVSDLLFTPDGKRLISSSGDQTIRLWDWSARKQAGVLRGHLNEVDGLAVAPDGQTLASRCKNGSIYLWDLTKPFSHAGYQTIPSRVIPDSAVFTTNSQSILGVKLDRRVAFWDALTVKETHRLWGDSTNRAIGISPDAKWVVRNDRPGHFGVWDVRSGLERTNLTLDPEALDDLR